MPPANRGTPKTQEEKNTPRRPAQRERTHRVAHSVPYPRTRPKMRSTPPGHGKKASRSQANRRGQKCRRLLRTRNKQTHQSNCRPERTSGGRQEPQRREKAPNSGSQSIPDNRPRNQQEPKRGTGPPANKGTPETQDEENTPRHLAHNVGNGRSE